MRVLVTGVCGFIGSHLAERLLDSGYDVLGIDCYLDNYSRELKEQNLKILERKSNFSFLEDNIISLNIEEILNGVNGVFHQAAIAGVRASWGKNFQTYLENNILATQLLLEASKGRKIDKFVYASSSSVYGDSTELPVKEDSPTVPISPYGVTKLGGEKLAVLYHKNFDVPTVSLRYFTVYGPRQRPDMGIHKFISSTVRGEDIEIYGDGEQTRDFTYVDDIVEANILAFEKGRNGGIYNIGGASRIKLIDCINLIKEISNKSTDVKFCPVQKGDAKHTFSDISKAREELGYIPKVGIEDGLKNHYDWLANKVEAV